MEKEFKNSISKIGFALTSDFFSDVFRNNQIRLIIFSICGILYGNTIIEIQDFTAFGVKFIFKDKSMLSLIVLALIIYFFLPLYRLTHPQHLEH